MTLSALRMLSAAALLCGWSSGAGAQPGRKSQLATVSQLVGQARIEIVYRRPVARGRELFGALVPWGKAWSPSADSAALFSTSTDLTVAGSRLPAGRYALWMVPDRASWSVIFSSAQPAFHLRFPQARDEMLRVKVQPREGDHMETLAFYFPTVDGDSAVLNMHWGKTVVPIPIHAP
ncbi:MAG: DUF2911 domain-containing protein [Gemmatimonadales bacterium]